ncbi:MAG: S8 family serine peptidase, partial [Chloroflexota bacterium]
MSLSLILAVTASAVAQDGGGGFTATPLTPEATFSNDKGDGQNLVAPSVARIQAGAETGFAGAEEMVSVIVKLTDESLATYEGGIAGLPATSPNITGAGQLDVNSPESQLYLSYLAEQQSTFEVNAKQKISQAIITNHYDVILGGVSMLVPASQVEQVAGLPGVEAVYLDELLQIETDRSPAFIGAPTAWNDLGGQESAGEGVIVGVLDTGIWPEHPSFSDPDPSGKPYAAPPPPPVGTRACQFGSVVPGDTVFTCNNKLIGARRSMATYQAFIPLLPGEFLSARDDNGHGTHTASTAAGNAGVAASIFGVSRGTISGIAPRAHVIMYKVCGDAGCFGSDSAAAVQRAIRDGVNVINFSISGGTNPYSDAVELAFLDAYTAGVFVAASAGNSGPGADTVAHRGPWVTTVAASTTDRAFKNTVTLSGAGGATLSIRGTSLTGGASAQTPVVDAGGAPTNDPLCLSSTADGAFAGKIVICRRGGNGRVEKGFNVLQRGAAGMILYNQAANVTDLETDNHFLPTTHIQFDEGQQVLAFLAANPGATATL